MTEEDLPFPVTVLRSGEIAFGDTARGAPALWIGYADGQLFVQPEGGVRNLLRNGAPLVESTWLDPGDTLSIGGVVIEVSEEDGLFVLADGAAGAESPPPPHRPPPPMAPPRRRLRAARRPGGRRLRIAAAAVLAVVALGVAGVLAVSPVRVRTDPSANSLSLTGFFPPVPLAGRYLVLPGTYTVTAEKKGYRRLDQKLSVALGDELDLTLRLQKLPGYLSVRTTTPPTATVSIDGHAVGKTPLADVPVEPGRHEVKVSAPRYKPAIRTIEIEGRETRDHLSLALAPAWGTLDIATDPPGAEVKLDGKPIGQTPLRARPLEGDHRLDITKDKWKPVAREVRVVAGQAQSLSVIRLEKSDGKLAITSTPTGATVTVDGAYRGATPLEIPVAADRKHKLILTKPGYEITASTASAGPDQTRTLKIAMMPRYGTVFIVTHPADAELIVDGTPMGRASRRLRLTTVPHKLEIIHDGYEPRVVTVTPRVMVPSSLDITLRTEKEASRAAEVRQVNADAGQKMIPVWIDRPVTFEVGSLRGGAGRRSNETRYKVELTRSFFVGAHEVTNAEFRAFMKDHNSGSIDGVSLNAPNEPVASVSWQDAARYANWLSAKAGLPPAYVESNGKLVPTRPMSDGYRLPTEAEWVYVARYEAGKRPLNRPLRFPWGDTMPPTGKAGNFADASARREFPNAIPSYSDGYMFAAPVESFAPNRAGFYDLGGNVSEWCNDFYDIRTFPSGTVPRDPLGPKTGRYHVVRGSSWRQGGVSELRFAWRDFGIHPRKDLGFRIARYAN